MAQPNFDYESALNAGYTEKEIVDFLKKESSKSVERTKTTATTSEYKNFDYQSAIDAGYSPDEINDFLSKQKPERSMLEKAGRVGAQYALGAAEMAALPYEVGTLGVGSKESQIARTRETIADDVENLLMKKAYGEWSPEDEVELKNLKELWKNPERIEKEITHQPIDISIRGLAERATGVDLHPEGILEKAASWTGFIKKPANIKEIVKLGLKPKDIKEVLPTLTEATRGLAAGTALQMAEEGNFGPGGTIAAAIVGDISGHVPKSIFNLARSPKKTAAQIINLATGANSKKEWIKEIISEADKSGIQLDAGTLTDSNIIRMAQARASQSALSGDALDNFRKNLSSQIVNKYEAMADNLGTLAFENNHQAAEAVREFVNQEEKSLFKEPYSKEELKGARPLEGRIATEERPDFQQDFLNRIAPEEFKDSYVAGEALKTVAEDIKAPIKEEFNHRWENLNRAIEEIPAGPQAELAKVLETFVEEQKGSLLLGESAAESRVLQAAKKLKDALVTEEGSLIGVTLRDLIKTKRTLGDIANWEFGGSNFQSAYKKLVGELDRVVERSLEEFNPQLRQAYEKLNAEYSMFKDVFENKNVLPLFEPKNENYNTIYNSFIKNPDKLRSLEDMMFASPEGKRVLNQVKRDYAKRAIESPSIDARELRNLQSVLGPEFEQSLQEFAKARQHSLDHPLPTVARQQEIRAQLGFAQPKTATPLTGKGTPKAEHARRKLFDHIKGKSSEQIMKQMDTVEGIKNLKSALGLTADGKELFNKLARYKLFEIIDKHMMDSLGENLKTGKFSSLIKGKRTEAVVKELIGSEAFDQLRLLQKNAARLQQSLDKFYNFSKSGTTLADVASVSTLVTGIVTGNPYLVAASSANIAGTYLGARLLSDAKFLQYLKEATLTNNKDKFLKSLKSMKPSVNRAIAKSILEDR